MRKEREKIARWVEIDEEREGEELPSDGAGSSRAGKVREGDTLYGW